MILFRSSPAGDLLVKAAVGSDFIRPTADMDNMITPLFKTVITAGLKKSDTEHRVNRHAQPAIIANNDFRRKKNLSKSMDAQIHTLKSNSRKLHSQQRQIVDVKNSGNFWRLTQRRLFSRASSRDGSPRGRSRPVSVGQHADTGAAVVEHFPMPIKDEREWREARKQISITKNSMGTESLVSEITHFSRELSSDAVAQAVVRLEGAGAFASVDEYSDDFHTVSDIKPFSVVLVYLADFSYTFTSTHHIGCLVGWSSQHHILARRLRLRSAG